MITEIKVGLNFGSEIQSVGRLAEQNGIIYFEYAEDFVFIASSKPDKMETAKRLVISVLNRNKQTI
jgi:hypothetical protein